MQAEAFVKYQRRVRKPCYNKKEAAIKRLDSKKVFTSINVEPEMPIANAKKMEYLL